MTLVRRAKFADIPEILRLVRISHAKSRFSDDYELNEGAAKAMAFSLISNMKDPAEVMSTAGFVSECADGLSGMIFGSIQPAYMAIRVAVVSNSIWFVDRDRASGREALSLLDALNDWALTCDWPVKALHQTNDYIEDPARLDALMRRAGHRLCGGVYEKELRQ